MLRLSSATAFIAKGLESRSNNLKATQRRQCRADIVSLERCEIPSRLLQRYSSYIQSRTFSTVLVTEDIASELDNTSAEAPSDELFDLGDEFASLFDASPVVNISKSQEPLMLIPDQEWGLPSPANFLEAVRAKAAQHLLVTEETQRQAIEIWIHLASIHVEKITPARVHAVVSECLAVANPSLAVRLLQRFSRYKMPVSREAPKILCHMGYFRESIAALECLLPRHKVIAAAQMLGYNSHPGRKRALAYVLEGILIQCGEDNLHPPQIAAALIHIAEAEPINVVGALARRWAERKLLSVRRLTCLRVASLAVHRRFDEILDIFKTASEQKMLSFQPEDYSYLIKGFLASHPITLAPLLEQLTILSEFVSPSSQTLEQTIITLVTSLNVIDEAERAGNLVRALALFSWLTKSRQSISAQCWTVFIEKTSNNDFVSTCESILNSAEELAATDKSIVPADKILVSLHSQMSRRKIQISPERVSAFAKALADDKLLSWPNMFQNLPRHQKQDEVQDLIKEEGSKGLPAPILEVIVPFLFEKSEFETICNVVEASKSAGHKLEFKFEPFWRMYLDSCSVTGKAEQILDFVHPDEEAHPGSTISARIRSISGMRRPDLVEKIERELSDEQRMNPAIRSALQEVSLAL